MGKDISSMYRIICSALFGDILGRTRPSGSKNPCIIPFLNNEIELESS